MSKKEAFSELLGRKPVNPSTQVTGNTETQEDVTPPAKKKKATFDLDADLHRRLKVYAAQQNGEMVDIVSRAIDLYLKERNA